LSVFENRHISPANARHVSETLSFLLAGELAAIDEIPPFVVIAPDAGVCGWLRVSYLQSSVVVVPFGSSL
jgi:hypothetical protein